jgi:ADP-heptose:LPS heptosyltransferase
VSAVGRLDMPAAAAAVARARLYVGADSGLGHAAGVVGAPTLSLFGPTEDRRYAPWGPKVQVIRGGPSMADLSVDQAYAGAAALIARTSS